jgi:1-deoxy-D-xylulose-5-phosphate synthase
MGNVLDKITSPSDLRGLSIEELDQLSSEIRSKIVDSVSRTGGHLAANLGVVELTVALCRVFDPGRDKILWDVSHQCYTYKILTGRKDRMSTLRQYGGLSGFLKRDESPFDWFGAGHSGTALSAALGFAVARDRRNTGEHVLAVVGDGAAGCGTSLEALNNVDGTTHKVILILNDNEMSISSNVGALSKYLGGLLVNPRYNRWKRSVEKAARGLKLGWLRSVYYKMEEFIKGMFLGSVMFEEFGLRYIGPVDGHNMRALMDALTIAKEYDRSIVVHVTTDKGRGYPLAEESPEKWHGTSPFDVASGQPISIAERPSYSNVFGLALEMIAKKDDRIMAISAGMAEGTGLTSFTRHFPDRFFDVGICEEHAVIFAAGLAAGGFRPVVAMYSTFMQRVVDYVIHDVCLQNLPVIFCVDRAGVVGDDGPTHHGVFDISLFRTVPNLVIMQPADEAELADMLNTAVALGKPVLIRYPRGVGSGVAVSDELKTIEEGRAKVETEGRDVQLWALGDMLSVARAVAGTLQAEGISAGVVNARFVKPLDTALLDRHAGEARLVATLENGVADGGFGSAVEEHLVKVGFRGRILRFGWPDKFVPHGANALLFKEFKLTRNDISDAIRRALGSTKS